MQKEGLTRKRREVNQNEAGDPGAGVGSGDIENKVSWHMHGKKP